MKDDKITLSGKTEIDAAIKKLAKFYPRARWGGKPNKSAIIIEVLREAIQNKDTAEQKRREAQEAQS